MPRRRILPGPRSSAEACPSACAHRPRPASADSRSSTTRGRVDSISADRGGSAGARRRGGLRPGGERARGQLEQSATRSRSIDKSRRAFRRLARRVRAASESSGFGFDRDDLVEAGIDGPSAVAAVTSGDNSNILSARIARENFGIERVVARIYDPRRARDLPAARHPDRGDRRRGRPTRCCAASCRATSSPTTGSTRAARSCLVDYPIPGRWAGKKLAALNEPGKFWLAAVTRFGAAQVVDPERDRPGGRRAPLRRRRRRARRAARAAQRGTGALMRVAIAGAGNVGLFIANDLRAPATRCCSSSRARRWSSAPSRRRRRRVAHRRRVRGELAPRRRARPLRRRGRRDRRRRGQPGGLAARQAGVRGAAGDRPGEPPEERVALQRELGRRPLGVDTTPDHRARGRGGDRRAPRPHPPVRGRPGAPRRGHARRRLARGRQGDQRGRRPPRTPRSWRSCATSTS